MAPSTILDLSDEQIDELLVKAAARLKKKETAVVASSGSDAAILSFPKLNPGKQDGECITNSGHIAKVNQNTLASEKSERESGGFRKVEDPVAKKQRALAVSSLRTITEVSLDEIISQFCLEQSLGTVLVAFLQREGLFIIVTLTASSARASFTNLSSGADASTRRRKQPLEKCGTTFRRQTLLLL